MPPKEPGATSSAWPPSRFSPLFTIIPAPLENRPRLKKPLLIFDGDCSFCRYWISRWRSATGDKVDYAPYRDVAVNFPDIPLKNFQEAVHLLLPSGDVFSGAEAAFRTLAFNPRRTLWLRLYQHLPGFKPVADAAYRVVARHRPFFSRFFTPF